MDEYIIILNLIGIELIIMPHRTHQKGNVPIRNIPLANAIDILKE